MASMRWMPFGLVLALAIQGCMSPPEGRDEAVSAERSRARRVETPQEPPAAQPEAESVQPETEKPAEPEFTFSNNDREAAAQYVDILASEFESMISGIFDMLPLAFKQTRSQLDATVADYVENYYKRAIMFPAPRVAKDLHAEYIASIRELAKYFYEVAEASRTGRPKPEETTTRTILYSVQDFCKRYHLEVPPFFKKMASLSR